MPRRKRHTPQEIHAHLNEKHPNLLDRIRKASLESGIYRLELWANQFLRHAVPNPKERTTPKHYEPYSTSVRICAALVGAELSEMLARRSDKDLIRHIKSLIVSVSGNLVRPNCVAVRVIRRSSAEVDQNSPYVDIEVTLSHP